ncbi:carbon monoxide dehydrogenase subunit G [Lichenihabitans sp. Uapishka_5]|uniref:CoxG family protein n=1 Tax=Lichenihabitans sp. Uapishka_5 TaxID=3037302 RepID=UPI0029E8073B|nr:carbon monoxide dehydrogenase subunit G [Lichenihabitans sp. Uapishka_5]MDX7949597.1 carbon monoxide dehydrogenase subunit G [Lichenihabitans sp. Uapishka_5]
MATTMEGTFTVPAAQELVWTKLNDPEVLRLCISGCDSLEKTSATHFVATAKMRVGPLRTTVRGKLDLYDVDAPHGCRIVGEGEGGIAGFARGIADVRLFSVPEGTLVTYAVEATVGGRLSHFGGKLINGVAKRMADGFFANFAATLPARPVTAA